MQLETRIARYLDTIPGAISGSRGHDQTFTVAVALVWGFALDTEAALRWMGIYNAKCAPPWKDRELRHKVVQAEKTTHEKPRGHLLGTGEGQRVNASMMAAKPVPVRLTPRKERFRTLRTTIFNPYGHTREKELPHTHRSLGAFHPSEASGNVHRGKHSTSAGIPVDLAHHPAVDASTIVDIAPTDWTAINAEFPPDDEEKNWRAVVDAGFGDEPLVLAAFTMFGPGCTVLETEGEA